MLTPEEMEQTGLREAGLEQPPQQPPLQTTTKHKVHHSYIWLGSITTILSVMFFLILYGFITVVTNSDTIFEALSDNLVFYGLIAVAALVLLAGLVFFFRQLFYKYLWYEIGPEEFSFYSGVLNKKKVHVPYQKVQSVNQRASLIQRIFGVCVVHIDTAGGALNKAIIVPYLRKSDAEWLRFEIFARKQAAINPQAAAQLNSQLNSQLNPQLNPQMPAGYGAATPSATPAMLGAYAPVGGPYAPAASPYVQAGQTGAEPDGAGNVLDLPAKIAADAQGIFGGISPHTGAVSYAYGLTNKELFLTGLSHSGSLALVIAVILSTLGGLIGQLLESAFGSFDFAQGAGGSSFLVFVIAGSIAISFLVIWFLSVISTCVFYGGFKACRRLNRVEVEHGILQHRFYGVDVDRIQSVIIKQSFIRRIIGYCEISLGRVDTASQNTQEGNTGIESKKGLVVHPFVRLSKAPEIIAGLIPEFAETPTEDIKLPKKALRRAIIRHCILFGEGFYLALAVAITQIVLNLSARDLGSELYEALPAVNAVAVILYVLAAFVIALSAIKAVMWYRGSSFAYNKNYMRITNGGFSRESVSFPRVKVQFGHTRTNPFQRISKLATVNARTAAGIGGTTVSLVDAAETDASDWVEWLKPRRNVGKPSVNL